MKRLLIAGAGFVGEALALRALAEGSYRVSILRRRADTLPGVATIQADLLQSESLQQLGEVEDVVYCASADASDEESYRKIYQQGLSNLVTVLRARGGFRRLVYISSTSVYAEQGGAWVDENDQNLVKQGPSRFMVHGEDFLRHGPEDACILRMGGIYGPNRTYFLRRVKEGRERLYTGGGLYSNRIHRDDCVGITLHVLGGEAERQVYNGVDCESADRNEVIRWMARQFGMDPETLPTSDDLKQIGARGNKRISNRKILEAGYRFAYPSYREGYTALLRELEGS